METGASLVETRRVRNKDIKSVINLLLKDLSATQPTVVQYKSKTYLSTGLLFVEKLNMQSSYFFIILLQSIAYVSTLHVNFLV